MSTFSNLLWTLSVAQDFCLGSRFAVICASHNLFVLLLDPEIADVLLLALQVIANAMVWLLVLDVDSQRRASGEFLYIRKHVL